MRLVGIKIFIFGLGLFLIESGGFVLAQEEHLPSGIGTYRLGYRAFFKQTHKYNTQGELEPLAASLNQDFSGKNLLEGVGGDELQKFAKILNAIDVNSARENSLLNELYLGRLRGKAQGDISAYFLAVAYGLCDYWTIMIGAPWVRASVKADLWFEPGRDPRALEPRIGDVGGFMDLKEGLVKAANITTETINATIEAKGYRAINNGWKYEGIGDSLIGSVLISSLKLNSKVRLYNSLTSLLSIPTGYVDDPDILTDVSIGKGYYQLSNRISSRLIYKHQYWFGLDFTYGYGFPTTAKKRIPKANESLIDLDRKINVNLNPGSDIDSGVAIGYVFSVFKLQYKLGFKKHTKDYYKGSIDGNYDVLSKDSELSQIYHEPSIAIDTVEKYKQNKFFIPMTIILSAHFPIIARNSLDERYIELSIQSFFTTNSSTNMVSKNTRNKKNHHYNIRKKSFKAQTKMIHDHNKKPIKRKVNKTYKVAAK